MDKAFCALAIPPCKSVAAVIKAEKSPRPASFLMLLTDVSLLARFVCAGIMVWSFIRISLKML
jgi:hypothetical protein